MKTKLEFILFMLLIFCAASQQLVAERYYNKAYGYYCDIPQNWEILEGVDPSRVSFTDPQHVGVFQIVMFPGSSYESAEEMYFTIKAQLKAEGDEAPFDYMGKDALFSDLTFNPGNFQARGYFIFINGEELDMALMTFTPVKFYEQMHDFLLSAMNSFSPDEESRYYPGPVSQFYYPFPGQNGKAVSIDFEGEKLNTEVDKGEIEASQVIIELEARVLKSYEKDKKREEAWKRYYRMILRDNYHRLDNISNLLKREVGLGELKKRDIAVNLLTWIQGFEYLRTGTLSYLLSPFASVVQSSGDCDSRGLLYIILLHHFDIDSILMVSSRYGHSLVGVDIAGEGAHYSYGGKKWLVAEVTDNVDIGLIPKEMADPSGWIPVSF
ncbi:MAG: hypothetical protein DRP87_10520 [Spirochaetes bacterium]|nr:MAG: hypothetical protein DRP87_10520 [Spirochaetota bacterium]